MARDNPVAERFAGPLIINLLIASEEDGWQHLYSLSVEGGAPHLLTPGNCEVEQCLSVLITNRVLQFQLAATSTAVTSGPSASSEII